MHGMVIRIVQIALLIAIIIPFGVAVRWGVERLGQRGLDFGSGIVLGLRIGYALWRWDERIKERHRRGDFRYWD